MPERPDDDPTVRPARPVQARTAPFRHSVDVPPARHRAMQDWCRDAERALGFEVTAMATHNVLVKLLLRNESLAREVRADPDLRPEPKGKRK